MSNSKASDERVTLPRSPEALEALIRERTATLNSQVQILNALDYPIVRTNPDDTMEFINNAFFEYAELPGLDRPTAGDLLRREYAGRTVLDYILPDDRERFENLKARARERRFTDAAAKFVVGVKGEFTFVSHTGRQTPVSLSITYAKIYDKYQLNFIDISELKQAQDELRQAHDELELRVLERTAELQQANEQIRQQADAIMELSTPVIRLWKGIVLMPLIGVIDTARAAQMTDRLLESISHLEGQVAILDVTGVPVIDTSVARHLLGAVNAAKILGSEVVITGFSPITAQTLVQLGVDFSALRTRGSLQAGITEALSLVGKRVVSRT